jgi:hypothetical protein
MAHPIKLDKGEAKPKRLKKIKKMKAPAVERTP